jgi:2-oxoacid:acceptor oxidoreductase delta subunit (pyruvate/2-ketoisovalerate family)
VGHGRLAAVSINAYLTGQPMPENTHSHDHVMTIGDLNTHYFTIAVPSEQSRRPVQECVTNFDETVAGLSESQARYEAQRCLSCGTCIRCSTCFSVCPDSAIRRNPDGTYEVDSQYCKGCGICAQECPSGAIVMK